MPSFWLDWNQTMYSKIYKWVESRDIANCKRLTQVPPFNKDIWAKQIEIFENIHLYQIFQKILKKAHKDYEEKQDNEFKIFMENKNGD